MRYLPRSVIPFSMMVVVCTGAGKAARAQDSETGTAAPAFAPAASDPDAGLAPAPEAPDDAQPRRKRRAKAAQVGPAEAAGPASSGALANFSHYLQTGLSLMPGTGYRLIVRYTDHQYCADSSGAGNKPVCARRLPTFLDVQLAFGALARMDVILDFRFGLEEDPAISGGHQFALAPGLRFWLDQDRALKFFTTLQFVYDYTDFSGSPDVPSHDFGLRNANGLMYDLMHSLGLYVQFGETLGFRRWFRIDIDIGLGAQVRFP
jgi:hypothetical protein